MSTNRMKDKRQNLNKNDKNVTFDADEIHFQKTFSLGYQNPEAKGVVRFMLLLDLTESETKSEIIAELIYLKLYLLGLLLYYKQQIFNNEIDYLVEFITKMYTFAVDQRNYDRYIKYKDENKDKYHKKVLAISQLLVV